jgi:hypothetical protein
MVLLFVSHTTYLHFIFVYDMRYRELIGGLIYDCVKVQII